MALQDFHSTEGLFPLFFYMQLIDEFCLRGEGCCLLFSMYNRYRISENLMSCVASSECNEYDLYFCCSYCSTKYGTAKVVYLITTWSILFIREILKWRNREVVSQLQACNIHYLSAQNACVRRWSMILEKRYSTSVTPTNPTASRIIETIRSSSRSSAMMRRSRSRSWWRRVAPSDKHANSMTKIKRIENCDKKTFNCKPFFSTDSDTVTLITVTFYIGS